MKRTIAMLLTALMLIASMVPALAEEPVELTILLCGNNVSDDTAVLEALNEYLVEKINVTLKPTWGTWGDFDERALNVVTSGSDEYDMMFTCSWTHNNYSEYSQKGAYVRLDDPDDNLLEQYGQDMVALLPELLIEGSKVEGPDGEAGIYAVPGFKDFATMNAWDLNVTMLEKYGYTVEDVQNAGFFGWDEIFATVKAGEEAENEGTIFYPFVYEGIVVERFVDGTPIIAGDANSLLSYYMNMSDVSEPGAYGDVIVNKYATDEFKAFAEQMRKYYEAGYIDPAIAMGETATDTWRNAQNTARYLISSESTLYGYEYTTSALRNIDVQYWLTTDAPFIDNTSVQGAMIAISANSENPEKCMQFLNLLNSDPYVMTTLNYGLEDVHFTKNDIGEITFTEVRESDYTVWTNGLGNITLLPPQAGQGADFWARFADFYAGSKKLPIYGFTFNPKPVENEVAAAASVMNAYALTLCCGAVDPEVALPEMLQKLEEAGMQKIVDEANAQYEAFLAGKAE